MKCEICGYDTITDSAPNHDICEAEHETGFVCTREEGHEGKHIACGKIDHPIFSWDDDENAEFEDGVLEK